MRRYLINICQRIIVSDVQCCVRFVEFIVLDSRVVGPPAPVKRYTLASVMFKNHNDVPKDLLFNVLQCYRMRLTVCRACFYKFRPQTEAQLKSFQPVQLHDQLVCGSCSQSFTGLLVMPSCPLCENNYGSFIPIASKGQSSPVHSVEEMILRLMDSELYKIKLAHVIFLLF